MWFYKKNCTVMNMSVSKRPKTYHFNDEWEYDFFFTMYRGKCICLICHSNVALAKKGNLERHFLSQHKKYELDFPHKSEIRKFKVKELKSQLGAHQLTFLKPILQSQAGTEASFRIANVLVKHKKSFQDGEMLKEAFINAGNVLFDKFKNKLEIMQAIKDIPLSRQSVTRRVEVMGEDLQSKLKADIENCSYFSLQFDESNDIVDSAQLIVFIRMVFSDMSCKEEFLTMISMKGQTRGEDIYQVFINFATKTDLPLRKLVCIATDGAPAMVGKNVGFLAFCKNNKDFTDFITIHCVIHQNALCAKALNMTDVMDITLKIVNSIRARSLRRRLFRTQLEENEAEYEDLLLYTDIRWLSRGRLLERFQSLLPEIIQFLESLGERPAQLHDASWLIQLAFLTDLTAHCNAFNLELQGKDKTITQLVSSLNAFKSKLQFFKTQLGKKILKNFPNLEKALENFEESSCKCDSFCIELQNLFEELERRFQDVKLIEPILVFMSFPFVEINIEEISATMSSKFNMNASDLEIEILKLQCDIPVKARASEKKFWNFLHEEQYPALRSIALRLTAFFGSTYLCEAAFSQMKVIKSKYRSRLTDEHLKYCLHMCLSNYEPSFSKLSQNMESHASTSQYQKQ